MTSPFLSDVERRALWGAISSPVAASPQADLVWEGEDTGSLFLVTAGWAGRCATTRNGGRQFTTLLVPGDICNVDSLVFEQLNYGVVALTAVTIASLPRQRAATLAREHPGIARTFSWIAALDNLVLSSWLVSLGRRSARERLAHLLCELSVRVDGERADRSKFDLPLTQEQIADVLGLTAVHVNRTLRHLREEGLIVLEGGVMTLPDTARIRGMAGFDQDYLHASTVSASSAS